ncbi:MAG: protoporphyrinogen/coproporphyrinogen oxidase [Microbacteriaceae bacterium]
MPEPAPFIVVGGGIAGLVTARDLAIGGRQVIVLEASDVLGGKVVSHTVGGIVLDAGAESFATRGGVVSALAAELGLGGEIVLPNPAGAWLQPGKGPALPLPRTGLLGIPGMPLARDVIAVVGLAGALRAELDALLTGWPAYRSRTLGELVRRRMGRRLADRLVVPVVMGVHSRHPDELAVDTVAPGLRAGMLRTGSLARAVLGLRAAAPAGSAAAGIRGGMFRLVEALQADLIGRGVQIRTGTGVAGMTADGVALAGGARLTGQVVLAAPIPPPPSSADPCAGRPVTLVTLVVDCSLLDAAPRGTGLLVAPDAAGIQAKALTHSTAKWPWLAERAAPHHHVLRLSYDGRAVAGGDLTGSARADAEKLLGVPLPPGCVIDSARTDWSAVTAASAADTGDSAAAEVGERVAGTGLAAVIGQARRQSEELLGSPLTSPDYA